MPNLSLRPDTHRSLHASTGFSIQYSKFIQREEQFLLNGFKSRVGETGGIEFFATKFNNSSAFIGTPAPQRG
ncbi:hypothetical protein BST81_13010 [Leptolyngbya sp. 'hensonii']|nr:hypothetical protein BST81_13010 [Leptolyngbya sp. 'hensonii']